MEADKLPYRTFLEKELRWAQIDDVYYAFYEWYKFSIKAGSFWQHKIKMFFSKSHLFSGGREMSLQQHLALGWEKNSSIKRLDFDWKNMSENGRNMYTEFELRELQQ